MTDIKLVMVILLTLSQQATLLLESIEESKMEFQQNCHRVVVEDALTHTSTLALIPCLRMFQPSQLGKHGNKLSFVSDCP